MLPNFLQFFLIDRLIDLLVFKDIRDAFIDFLIMRAALSWLACLRVRVDCDRRTLVPSFSESQA